MGFGSFCTLCIDLEYDINRFSFWAFLVHWSHVNFVSLELNFWVFLTGGRDKG